MFGDCWLGCRLWDELHLGTFWAERLPEGKAWVPWFKVLELLTVRQLVAPGSKWHLHRRWFLSSAMDQLLAEDFAVARIEAEPAKNPSFWTKNTKIEHRYVKVNDFWLPARNHSLTSVRLGGRADLTIEYLDYQVTPASLPGNPSDAALR